MTPYLVLKSADRRKVNKILEEHSLDDETFYAARALLEEVGDDQETIALVLHREERRGVMRAGTFTEIMKIIGKESTCQIDWRKIPRRRY